MDVEGAARALSKKILADERWPWANGCRYRIGPEPHMYMLSGAAAAAHPRAGVFLDVTDPCTAGQLLEMLKEYDWLIAEALSAAYEHDVPFGVCLAEQLLKVWSGDG